MKRLFFYTLLQIAIIGTAICQPSQKHAPGTLEAELEHLGRADLLPKYRIGIVEQISSYDRTGGNDDGFSGKYSYIRKEGKNLVIAEMEGPGVINRIWTPTPTNDTIQFYFDGETTPRINIPFIDLFTGKIFPFINPVCGNEVGGYYCYVPIQYSKSCKIVYCGELIQFHQIQWRPYASGVNVKTFTMDWNREAKNLLTNACRLWNKETTPLQQLKDAGVIVREETKQFFLSPGETVSFFKNNKGGRIVGIEIECGSALEGKNRDVILLAQWDNEKKPAIYSPAADFFGYAFGKPAMQSILAGNGNGVNYCYIPMPYEKSAELKMIYEKRTGGGQSKIDMKTKVYYLPESQNPATEGKLYTVWRRETNVKEGEPYLYAQIEDKGHYIGTIHIAQGLTPGMTLFFEGDDVTTIDGKMRMHGTGSEDYFNGGWYALLDRWDRGVSLPIHGSLDYTLPMCRTGGYRFYLTDKMTFEKDLNITIEHGRDGNDFPVDYTSVAFYYGSKPPQTTSKPTEELRTCYEPTEHVFFPQQMNFTLDSNTRIESRGNYVERIVASTDSEGMLRVSLSEVPEGRYKIYLSYCQTPDGGMFSVWNRQKMIADWKDVNAGNETLLKKEEIGEVTLTRHTNSITFRIKATDKGSKFHFENLFLERQ
jgi:hypothetical protein